MERDPKTKKLTPQTVNQETVDRALAGDESALNKLVDLLTPVIQTRVARSILRRDYGLLDGRVRQAVEDLTQEVFLQLFENDAKVIRTWKPERGLSLQNFVGLMTERRVASILRSSRHNPWTEEPTEIPNLDRQASDASPENRTSSRQRLQLILERVREELSPVGWHVFELLFLHECSVAEIGRKTNLSPDAIYAWRSRLRRLARRLAHEQELSTVNRGGKTNGRKEPDALKR